VGKLEALETVAGFSFLADNVKHRVDQLSTFGIMALSPVISGSGLSEHEVIRAKKLAKRTSADRVHGSRFQIHKDSTRNIAATRGLVEVYINSLQL